MTGEIRSETVRDKDFKNKKERPDACGVSWTLMRALGALKCLLICVPLWFRLSRQGIES